MYMHIYDIFIYSFYICITNEQFIITNHTICNTGIVTETLYFATK